tara:strand:- start:449 stop:634 length:186 start_codon:yes stop_codon:yes gene_type:complete
MKESDGVKFEDKYKALEYISKLPEENGRIEIKIVSKAQVEREQRIARLYAEEGWDYGCYKG